MATGAATRRDALHSGIDVLLADAAAGGTGASRFVQPRAAVTTLAALARRPDRVARRLAGAGKELTKIAVGRSELAPPRRDRRFADAAWSGNPYFRRLLQTHLALSEVADGLIRDAELGWQTERQARFTVSNVLDLVAPSNFALTNPSVIKETIDRGGDNLWLGARRFVRDVSRPPHLPAMVDTTKFDVGRNLAVTPGRVVHRTAVFELLQYAPTTPKVLPEPLIIAPPTINKFYVLDLGPGRSLVEHYVSQGVQVFMLSWRNPTADHAHFDVNTYADAILEAVDAARTICGADRAHLAGACSGGILASLVAGSLAAEDELDRLATLTLMVAGLDLRRAGDTAALASRETLSAAVAESARKGYVDGSALASVFAWLRPNDLIWNYVVNNYLMGAELPAFDVLYWNQDAVRMSAGTHRDFIRMAMDNALTRPGGIRVRGQSVDLSKVEVDNYVVAGVSDHIIPWRNAARSIEMLGGQSRFVLSKSGHVQALVNPPGPDSRSSFRVSDEPVSDPEAFVRESAEQPGSWWPDHVAWLTERSGAPVDAPSELGCASFPPGAAAPGSYVHET